MAGVSFEHVTKRFGDVVAVRDLTLDVADREFLVLLGPSGCGKSTALRMIAGLDEPTEGTIRIGNEIVNDVEPRDRDVAMVFQTYALYPHMTVRRNIEFPLKTRDVPSDERAQLVRDAADTLGLADLLDRKPAQLSGGQRQRVALARAIVRRPQAFLMDEPLSNLDAKLRVQTRADLIELQRRLETTVVYVTHDQVEAMTMGHRIAIIADGALQQVGPPQDVYERPANLFVAGFIGTPPMNIIRARVVRDDGALQAVLPGARVRAPRTTRERGQRPRIGGDRSGRAARAPRAGCGGLRTRDRQRGRVAGPRAQHRLPPRRRHPRDHPPGRRRAPARDRRDRRPHDPARRPPRVRRRDR